MAMTEISDVLDRVLKEQIEEVAKLTPGTVEHQRAEEALAKLYKERVAHYASDLNYDSTMSKAEDEKAKTEGEQRIEEEKLKIEREKIEVEKSKVANEAEKLKIESDKNAVAREQINLERDRLTQDGLRLKFDKRESWLRFASEVGSTVIHAAIEVASIILPLKFYHEWVQQGLSFEETGAFRSSTFKSIIGKFKPTKK